jgi:hypothetical protein
VAATSTQRQGNDYNIPRRAHDNHSEQPDGAQEPGTLSFEDFQRSKIGEYEGGLRMVQRGVAEILEHQEEIQGSLNELNWGRYATPFGRPVFTNGFDAVTHHVPYYILKKVAWRKTDPTQHACASAVLRLLVLGWFNSRFLNEDEYGSFYRKGVKRGLDEHTQTEPGEGGPYHRVYVDDDSESELDFESTDEDMEMQDLQDCMRRLTISPNLMNPNMSTTSQLNGSHGEWTESDDVERRGKKKGQGQGKRRPGLIRPNKPRRPKQARKRIIRETGIALASNFVGPEMARIGYQGGAKLLKGMRMSVKTLVLSSHASKYLLSFVKPFDNSVQQASIPRPPAVRSFKVTGFIRGGGQIGDAGFGFVAVNPVLCNDRPCCWYTTSAYTHNVTGAPINDFNFTTPTYKAGGVNWPASATMTNLPYSFASLTASGGSTGSNVEVAGRIVSCSMRVYYTGTTLNEGGSYYAYSDPDVNNVLGDNHSTVQAPTGYSAADLLSKDATEVIKVKNGSEARLVRVCTDPNMDDYPRNNAAVLRKLSPYCGGEYYNPVGDYVGTANMVIAIDGTPRQPFYFEVVTHVEYIGTGVTQGLLSDSNNDAVGYDCVKNLLQHAQREVASNPNKTFAQALQTEMRRQGVSMGHGQRSVDY